MSKCGAKSRFRTQEPEVCKINTYLIELQLLTTIKIQMYIFFTRFNAIFNFLSYIRQQIHLISFLDCVLASINLPLNNERATSPDMEVIDIFVKFS